MTTQILILIPAAGQSTRMRGTDKLMQQVDAEPLLTRQTLRALATGAQVLVTLNADFPDRAAALAQIPDVALATTTIPDPSEGMSASLRTGAAMAGTAPAMMVLLPDLPDLTTRDLQTLITAWTHAPDAIHQATAADGTPGHPVIFPARLFDRFADLSGDLGAKPIMQDEQIHRTDLPATHATRDLDTPEAWADWRRKTPAQ